jgi:hypothetical protein
MSNLRDRLERHYRRILIKLILDDEEVASLDVVYDARVNDCAIVTSMGEIMSLPWQIRSQVLKAVIDDIEQLYSKRRKQHDDLADNNSANNS